LEVEEGLWEKEIRKNASAKGLGSRDRVEERVYTEEGKGVFIVKRREGGSASVHGRSTVERVHSALQVTANIASTLRGKKGR